MHGSAEIRITRAFEALGAFSPALIPVLAAMVATIEAVGDSPSPGRKHARLLAELLSRTTAIQPSIQKWQAFDPGGKDPWTPLKQTGVQKMGETPQSAHVEAVIAPAALVGLMHGLFTNDELGSSRHDVGAWARLVAGMYSDEKELTAVAHAVALAFSHALRLRSNALDAKSLSGDVWISLKKITQVLEGYDDPSDEGGSNGERTETDIAAELKHLMQLSEEHALRLIGRQQPDARQEYPVKAVANTLYAWKTHTNQGYAILGRMNASAFMPNITIPLAGALACASGGHLPDKGDALVKERMRVCKAIAGRFMAAVLI